LRTPRLRPSSGSKTSRNDESKHAAVITRKSSTSRKPSLSCRGSPFYLTYKKGHRQCGGPQPSHSSRKRSSQSPSNSSTRLLLLKSSRPRAERCFLEQDRSPGEISQCSVRPGVCGEWWPEAEKGKGKAKQTKAAKGKGAKRAADEDTARLDDSEVKRQVGELTRLDEEEEEGGPPEAALVREEERFGLDEEDIPDAESSADAVRRGPTRSCKGR
jgi:hypothetical protein